MRKGILIGGNWIIDQVKVIDSYPPEERLANIMEAFSSNGGAAYNVLKDLFKMKTPFPLEGIGLVGKDERGDNIIEECKLMGIDVSQMKQTDKAATSYTDVMSVKSTGKRTFFHHRGANALLNETHFDFSISRAKIFYLGYLLLLDRLDDVGHDGSTGASVILQRASEQGFITAVDVVSEASERFKEIIPVSLPHIDYLFINEYEAGMLTGISTTDGEGKLSLERCYEAATKIINLGVKEWTVLHSPPFVLAVNKEGEKVFQSSVQLTSDGIVGSVGAGDAFAAGVLMGIHEGWDMKESLKLGVGVAAASLSSVTASDGVLPYRDCLALAERYGYYE